MTPPAPAGRQAVRLLAGILVAITPVLAQSVAPAEEGSERRFTFLDETLHGAPAGHFEFEQWVTWSRGTRLDSGVDRIDWKHELEYAITDAVHVGVDIAEWHTTDLGGEWHSKYDMTAAELRVRFCDPRTDAVGIGYKTELGIGPDETEWENILMIDKVVGAWEFAYNLDLETEFESEHTLDVQEGELAVLQSLGASYQCDEALYLGGEFRYEIPPEWSWGDRQNFFIGPNVSVHGDECALTTTALFLADGEATAPEFQLRFIFEIDF
jgi:hypothetical protein